MQFNTQLILFRLLFLLHIAVYAQHEMVLKQEIESSFYNKIGMLIWRNECASSEEKLTWWNEGEEFASLGIGHFIWYPTDEKKFFTQTFPELLGYLHKRHVFIPQWLGSAPFFTPCPWKTRKQFFDLFYHGTMLELRALLSSTIDLQARFIVMRTQKKLSAMMAQNIKKNKSNVCALIQQMRQSSNGIYALIDYINFKGDGTNRNERYHGQGWGLLQVLENMHCIEKNSTVVQRFVDAAKKILIQRVKNSPIKRNEQQFLAGWINRVNTYVHPF